MPGATELAIDSTDPRHILARATYGLVQSFDNGAGWQWICEAAIKISGEADPPMAVMADGTWVVLPPAGGALISQDKGCSWSTAPAPLADNRLIDLTIDPSDHAHLLVIMSSIVSIDDQGLVEYANVLAETFDNAKTWAKVSTLPSDISLETVEIAASNPKRIYVSGEASSSTLIGIIERSDDGGKTWTRTTLDLPVQSGTLLVSAVDAKDPDRLWIRLPAKGDTLGLFAASMRMSSDKGVSWKTLASTSKAMFGFALSPDGKELAYGGPFDGLYIGPSDGTGQFTKVSNLQVRCLRWISTGLYVCGTEPADPFSLGVSTDKGASFKSIYKLADTCPQVCSNGTQFEATCKDTWTTIGPFIKATGEACSVPWSIVDAGGVSGVGNSDAGSPEAGPRPADAGAPPGDAGALPGDAGAPPGGDAAAETGRGMPPKNASSTSSGCSCSVAGNDSPAFELGLMMLLSVLAAWRLRRR
jgi:MYXO-CTERM domain-containing protein